MLNYHQKRGWIVVDHLIVAELPVCPRITHNLLLCSCLGIPKECDLSKNPLTSSIHSANSFGHLTQPGSNNSGSSGGDSNGRLHVSSGLCDPHNMHQDQVGGSVAQLNAMSDLIGSGSIPEFGEV